MALLDVMCADPHLTAKGFESPSSAGFVERRAQLARSVDQFDRAGRWLQLIQRVKAARHDADWVKHQAERWARAYISEGSLIAACLHLGVPVKRDIYGHALLGLGSYRKWPGWPV
jgi:hypothetical protein